LASALLRSQALERPCVHLSPQRPDAPAIGVGDEPEVDLGDEIAVARVG
jgi:hypothetical protein